MLNEYAGWHFQVYVHTCVLRRESSIHGWVGGLVVQPLGRGWRGQVPKTNARGWEPARLGGCGAGSGVVPVGAKIVKKNS